MKALILAAGKGVRLRPITETRPKPLIPIACKPLIEWQLNALARINSIDEVIIVYSYLGEHVKKYIKNKEYSFRITFIDQGEELGTGDAVVKGVENLDLGEEVLILYGDIFLSDWSVLEDIVKQEHDLIVATEVDDPKQYGVLIVENNMFKGVIEKPENPPSRLINAGIYKLHVKDILEHSDIPFSSRGEKEFTDIITRIGSEKEIHVYVLSNTKWIDIGLPWNVLEANKYVLEKMKEQVIEGVIEENVSIKGPVYIGKDSRIRSGTYIEGPVYIDRETDIGPNARIRPYTSICRGAKIGFSVEVKESIVMEYTHVAHLSYIGDSILCEHVNFGAGTITANLRFDDKPVKMVIKDKTVSSGRRKLGAIVGAYVKTGINVSLMPGVKIGSHTWIAPGAVVYRDVPAKKFYRWIGKYNIVDLET